MVVPVDGSAVTVPAGPGFVADLGSVTVEGAPGVFSEATEVRVTHTDVGIGQHSRFSTTAGQSVLLDFGGVEPAAPLTLRYSTGRAGLKAEHVTPVVWDYEIEAWVPTIGDEVTVRDGEIIVKTPATSSATVTGTDLNGVTVAAGGFASPPVQVSFHSDWLDRVNPCNLPGASEVCDAAGNYLGKVVNVEIPGFVKDVAREALEGVVDIAGLAAEEIVEKAREYLPGVMAVIESAVDAGIALVENWLLPVLADFLGLRAKPPSCSGLAPDWARDGIDFSETDNPRVHLCTETNRDESLRVRTVNNRNFGFQVTSNDVPFKNFKAQQHPDFSLESVLAHEVNRRLVDKLALDGYQWPLRGASFDIAEFERSDRPESTTQWKITKETAVLDAISMTIHLLRAAADWYPKTAIFVAVAECVILNTPIPGVPDVGIEQSKHWTAILLAVARCLDETASGSIASNPSVIPSIGEREAVQLKFLSKNLSRAKVGAAIAKHTITGLELGLESRRQPPTLTVQPTETPDDNTQPDNTQPDDTDPPPTPTAAAYSAVSAGGVHSCGLRTDATITCWGRPYSGETDASDGTFSAVSARVWISCGLRTDATITCWGDNGYGQVDAPDGTFNAVSAGSDHSCGLRTDATITCWGYNNHGRTDAPDGTFSAVSAGITHSCGLRTDATITCWGSNEYGQVDAPDGTFSAVSAGWSHSCGLRTDATITCWGSNEYGQVDAPDGTFSAVSAGGSHSCGLRTDATITCWGNNDHERAVAPGGTFSAVSAGGSHSCGLRTDATITCWGGNWWWQADVP